MPERADVLQVRLGLGLHRLGQSVEHVRRLVDPAALDPGHAVDLVQGSPEPHGTVTHGKLWRNLQTPALQVQEQFPPALGALAKAIDQAQNILVAPFVSADNHQHTLAILIHSRAEIDTVRPEVGITPRRQIALGPAFIIAPPIRLQPGDGRG